MPRAAVIATVTVALVFLAMAVSFYVVTRSFLVPLVLAGVGFIIDVGIVNAEDLIRRSKQSGGI